MCRGWKEERGWWAVIVAVSHMVQPCVRLLELKSRILTHGESTAGALMLLSP